MVDGDRIEGMKYYLEIWETFDQYREGYVSQRKKQKGVFMFDTFEDLWCFVDTYREHHEGPNSLDFEVACH